MKTFNLASRLTLFLIIIPFILIGQDTFTHPDFWQKISDNGGFPPQDSSPNACVVHNGEVWIMGGYINSAPDVWYSKSDIWKSSNNIDWESVNESPPFSPYCAFISYKGYLWAFGSISFKSIDGVNWDTVKTNIPLNLSNRVTIFNDELWMVGTKILKSSNGVDWSIVHSQLPWGYREWPGFVTFKNKLWFFGGGTNYFTYLDYYYNDVWSSVDGINWICETQNAAWSGRYWFAFNVFDDKIWLLGGWDFYRFFSPNTEDVHYGNLNDVWYTEDGSSWYPLKSNTIWEPRHANYTWVNDDKFWLSAGYGHGGSAFLYNDIWILNSNWRENKFAQNLQIQTSNTTIAYGETFNVKSEASTELPTQLSYSRADNPNHVSTTKPKLPGDYLIHVTQEGNSIFDKIEINVFGTITKKDLLVSAYDTLSITFGESIPAFDLTYEGFVYDEDRSAIEILPKTFVSDPSYYPPTGSHQVVISDGYSSKYNLIFESSAVLQVSSDGPSFIAFPNPVVDYYRIYFSEPNSDIFIRMFDLKGKEHFKTLITSNSIEIDMRQMAQGFYILEVSGSSSSQTYRVIKI